MPAFIRATETILEFPMIDQDPLPWWSKGRVTLLGDAAHPMYPRGSNGAGQAILDARSLTDKLSTTGDAVAALKAYEASMQVAPNRLRGFYGAAKAAEAVGDKKKAATYMRSLAQLTRNADSDRPEIREAKQQRLASR